MPVAKKVDPMAPTWVDIVFFAVGLFIVAPAVAKLFAMMGGG